MDKGLYSSLLLLMCGTRPVCVCACAGNYVPIRVRWAGERCSVCDADTDYDFDQLVTCDLCGITVHQVAGWLAGRRWMS